jgi:hypothetical protein
MNEEKLIYKLVLKANELVRNNKDSNLRYGQALMIALDVDSYKELAGEDEDCFFDDSKITIMLEYLINCCDYY